MKNFEAKKLLEKLNNIENSGDKLPAVINFARYKNIKKLTPIVESYNKALDDILVKYGTATDEPGRFKIERDKMFDYIKETNELANVENELFLDTFPVEKLDALPDLSPEVFDAIAELANEAEPVETPAEVADMAKSFMQ